MKSPSPPKNLCCWWKASEYFQIAKSVGEKKQQQQHPQMIIYYYCLILLRSKVNLDLTSMLEDAQQQRFVAQNERRFDSGNFCCTKSFSHASPNVLWFVPNEEFWKGVHNTQFVPTLTKGPENEEDFCVPWCDVQNTKSFLVSTTIWKVIYLFPSHSK